MIDMGYAVGKRGGRWIGYGVPAECDQPECATEIDRGMGYICGDIWGDDEEEGCGLFFCTKHGGGDLCDRCAAGDEPFSPKPDITEWVNHLLTDESWAKWRDEHPDWVSANTGATDE